MSEKLPQNPDYLKHHPDAEEDIDRAHAIALAREPVRSEAIVNDAVFDQTVVTIYRVEFGRIAAQDLENDPVKIAQADMATRELMRSHEVIMGLAEESEIEPEEGQYILPTSIQALIRVSKYRLSGEDVDGTSSRKSEISEAYTALADVLGAIAAEEYDRAKAREAAAAEEHDTTQAVVDQSS